MPGRKDAATSVVSIACLLSAGLLAEAFLNVALSKRATFCEVDDDDDGENSHPSVTDGVKDPENGAVFTGACQEVAQVTVHLGREYPIYYVVVYEASSNVSLGRHLDYFKVDTGENPFLCGFYPRPSFGPGKAMRVNCVVPYVRASRVILKSGRNRGLAVSEIEAYTFGLVESPYIVWISRGCTKRFSGYKTTEFVDWKSCRTFCSGFQFVGIENRTLCHCGHDHSADGEIPLSDCHVSCHDENYRCGGNGTYSVYLISVELPRHLGCQPRRTDTFSNRSFVDKSMTVVKCLHFCEHERRATLSDGNTCTCYNDTIAFSHLIGQHPKFCDTGCSGGSESFCGGIDHVSVYRLCHVAADRFTLCSSIFRCHDAWNELGTCQGGCKASFSGVHCLEKDSKDVAQICQTYAPCRDVLNSDCIQSETSYTCRCRKGFSYDDTAKICIKMVERMLDFLLMSLLFILIIIVTTILSKMLKVKTNDSERTSARHFLEKKVSLPTNA